MQGRSARVQRGRPDGHGRRAPTRAATATSARTAPIGLTLSKGPERYDVPDARRARPRTTARQILDGQPPRRRRADAGLQRHRQGGLGHRDQPRGRARRCARHRGRRWSSARASSRSPCPTSSGKSLDDARRSAEAPACAPKVRARSTTSRSPAGEVISQSPEERHRRPRTPRSRWSCPRARRWSRCPTWSASASTRPSQILRPAARVGVSRYRAGGPVSDASARRARAAAHAPKGSRVTLGLTSRAASRPSRPAAARRVRTRRLRRAPWSSSWSPRPPPRTSTQS